MDQVQGEIDPSVFKEPAEFDEPMPFASHSSGNYFMDLYSIQTGPRQVEFGHVFENPEKWEQRYEKKDHDNKRFQGQARWGDKHGGYGEHYWDYNHGDTTEGASSSNVRGTLADPSSTDPSEVLEYKSTSPATIFTTRTSHRRPTVKDYKTKDYYNPSIRNQILSSSSEQPSGFDRSTEDDSNQFKIPKMLDSSHHFGSIEENGPYRVNLYNQVKGMPNIYNHDNTHKKYIKETPKASRYK